MAIPKEHEAAMGRLIEHYVAAGAGNTAFMFILACMTTEQMIEVANKADRVVGGPPKGRKNDD